MQINAASIIIFIIAETNNRIEIENKLYDFLETTQHWEEPSSCSSNVERDRRKSMLMLSALLLKFYST